ncbi:retrovirus-related pol polyprotein from transposon TNT 1-94 [Tanacetum coccineum]
MIQVRLNATVRNIGTDNGTESVNQTLKAYYEEVKISHQTSVDRTPQQNGVVEKTEPYFSGSCLHHVVLFKGSVISLGRKNLTYLIFTSLVVSAIFTNDGEDLGKLKPKADIGIFVGYAPAKKAFRIYNKRTQMIIETIHVDFDELTTMAS